MNGDRKPKKKKKRKRKLISVVKIGISVLILVFKLCQTASYDSSNNIFLGILRA